MIPADILAAIKKRNEKALLDIMVREWPFYLDPTVPITVRGPKHTAIFYVSTDYAGIPVTGPGALRLIRVSATPRTYQKLADLKGWGFPCPGLVRAIWAESPVRLLRFSEEKRDALATIRQNTKVDAELARRGITPGIILTAGAKKDVTVGLGNIRRRPEGNVAIYGWTFDALGKPYQTPTTIHSSGYVDYSHGYRPVDDVVNLDGVETTYESILRNPEVCHDLFGEEYSWTRYP